MKKNSLKFPGHDYFETTITGILKFELDSLIGRLFFNKKPPIINNEAKYLHLGSGRNVFENWVNADFYINYARLKFWKAFFIQNPKPNWRLDLRYPLNCKDNYWDGVFTEHTIEHLYPNDVFKLLLELNRTMKKGALLRIAVPDIEKYINFYIKKDDEIFLKEYKYGCEAIRNITQNYGHISVWDFEYLKFFLEKAGFKNIEKKEYREGNNQDLLRDLKVREWETLYVEAFK